MADFSETSVSRNAKRVFSAPIADINTFNSIVDAFTSDETMNIIKNKTSATYKTRVEYADAEGNDAGYCLFYGSTTEYMNNMAEHLANPETAAIAAGLDARGTIDTEQYHWLVKFSCTKNINIEGVNYEDNFTVSIGREYMLISGFAYDATLNSIETWADAQEALA